MRTIYIAVIAFFVLAIALFVSSFIVLDKENHKVWYYTVSMDGHDVGTIKVDRFKTEDKIIYKSVLAMPFAPLFTEARERISLAGDYALENYSKEWYAGGAADVAYIENRDDLGQAP